MNNNLEKIKELISKSDVSVPDQIDLITLFSKAKDEDLQSVLNLFSSDIAWIKKINDNFKAKQIVNITGNSELWKEILEEEEKELEKV